MQNNIHKNDINRRSFLKVIGWGSFFLTLGISAIASIRFFSPRVLFEKPSVFKVDTLEELLSDGGGDKVRVYEKWKKDHAVWIVREEKQIYALHAKCTHLGCTPNWFADDAVFKCPCHGSQFDRSGKNFAGPAPRPLDRFRISINDDGRISIDKSKTYTYKDFDKPGAYLKI